MINRIYFSPVLDRLLRDGEIDKVPYIHKSENWVPKVGDQCWSYKRNNIFTVVSVDTRSREVVLRWGCEDNPSYETVAIENIPKIDLLLRDWEFNKYELLSFTSVLDICKGYDNETSLRGAEIRTLCALGRIPDFISVWLERYYLMNTAKFKINDYVYYYIEANVEFHKFKLVRDLSKSPRKQYYTTNSEASELSESSDNEVGLIEESPQQALTTSTESDNTIIQPILNDQNDCESESRRDGPGFLEKISNALGFHKEYSI